MIVLFMSVNLEMQIRYIVKLKAGNWFLSGLQEHNVYFPLVNYLISSVSASLLTLHNVHNHPTVPSFVPPTLVRHVDL